MAVNFNKVDLISGSATGNGTNAAGSMATLAVALRSFNTPQTVANAQALVTAVDSAINYVSSIRGVIAWPAHFRLQRSSEGQVLQIFAGAHPGGVGWLISAGG